MRHFNWKEIGIAFRLHLVGIPVAIVYSLFVFGFWVGSKIGNKKLLSAWEIVYGVPFSILNFFFNVFVGSFIFLELPKELQFTRRLSRWKDDGCMVAAHLCEYLNLADPDHC